jgi:hypothetical protein
MNLAECWAANKAFLFNGIIFEDGSAVEINISGKKNQRVATIGLSTNLDQIQRIATQLTEIDSLSSSSDPTRKMTAVGGDGGFGADGFVGLLKNNKLCWFAFFDDSNPFLELKIEGNLLIAKNSLDEVWEFPVTEPQSLRIRTQSHP